ncbi:Mitochondrial succinate-fumarate transporter [Tieghemiomyces parasiticus]|uniref:Mitochondrial succinate-fumarate transporter n=1 Tax=Tieghemiomyces parasiticus TaxID=78921 RepID=A0A9W7ZTK6_9FUNG|nr:Mitochondrial succinate-fumarate transporter [Tieghemiomyces parasiticus]
MSKSNTNGSKKTLSTHLIAGGTAGCMEALVCHPLDTVKVRMQLRSKMKAGAKASGPFGNGFFGVGRRIAHNEGFLALYKGLGAVTAGIVPKMAIRFSSFEYYKTLLTPAGATKPTVPGVFFAGLFAGVTEAVMVVTPMDVIKIRLQAQRHSMMDPLDVPKYRNAGHAVYLIVKEEGVGALYKGVTLTALRQATNQAANFTAYQELKTLLLRWQPDRSELPSYQTLVLGGVSGAMGPLSNAPIDTIKTRIQKTPALPGETALKRFRTVCADIIASDGYRGFYKGLTPRLLRVAPGQAITFMVYEKVRGWMELWSKRAPVQGAETNY